jgi:perosamine synthetase
MIPIALPIINEEEIEAVTEVLRSGVIAQGKKVEEFEEAFVEYVETRYAVALNSGTAALHTALLAHSIGECDEVIVPAFTFAATANSVLFTGAKPVFADIEKESFNIDPDNLIEKITPRTKAIIPVHLYGQPCDIEKIMKIARQYNLVVIEDACQAHGARYQEKAVGSFSTGCFSFYPTKNMTTAEGGMLTTNDTDIAEKARMLRNHGQKERYLHEILGYNYRMTDLAAAIGVCQLKKLEQYNVQRQENARTLTEGLRGTKGLVLPGIKSNVKHVFHQYTVRVTGDFGISRDKLSEELRSKGIATGIYYPMPVYKLPLYRNLGYNDCLPESEKAAREVLSIPVHPALTREDLTYIIESLIHCQR